MSVLCAWHYSSRVSVRCWRFWASWLSGCPAHRPRAGTEITIAKVENGERAAIGPFPTRQAARAALFHFIEGFYNRQRLHSAIGYVTPTRKEQLAAAA